MDRPLLNQIEEIFINEGPEAAQAFVDNLTQEQQDQLERELELLSTNIHLEAKVNERRMEQFLWN